MARFQAKISDCTQYQRALWESIGQIPFPKKSTNLCTNFWTSKHGLCWPSNEDIIIFRSNTKLARCQLPCGIIYYHILTFGIKPLLIDPWIITYPSEFLQDEVPPWHPSYPSWAAGQLWSPGHSLDDVSWTASWFINPSPGLLMLKKDVSSPKTMWDPPIIDWFIQPMNTTAMSMLNHNSWNYKTTPRYPGGPTLYMYTMA